MKCADSTKNILIVDSDLHIHSVFKALCRQISVPVELTFTDHFDRVEGLLSNKNFHIVIADSSLIPQNESHFFEPVLWIGGGEVRGRHYAAKPLSLKDVKTKIEQLLSSSNDVEIIGGPSIQELLDRMKQIADYTAPVLLTGESGTGKELFARFIHQNSARALSPFTIVHCGAVSENLMESEFFGHKKGSFTGAVSDKKGFFEISNKGTLFLDELGALPLNLQAKLLRAVQDKKVRPLGSLTEYEIDVRIISATHRNLEQMIQKQTFREDLFHRLAVVHLEIPPLRDRMEDLPLLTQYFLEKNKKKYMKENMQFSETALEYLKQYSYPGNIRELENMIEKAVLFAEGDRVCEIECLKNRKEESNVLDLAFPSEGMDLTYVMRQAEKRILSEAIHRARGNREKAARLLKITPRSLKHRIHKYKLA